MVSVNKSKCIGCGACASACPSVFEIKDGKAYVKSGADAKKPCVKEAKESCPVNAIN